MIKVIVTGATGMVGKGVLLECLDHNEVSEVLSISRTSLEMNHPKLTELIHKDFTDFSPVKDHLAGYDACFHCMGVSSAGMKEDEYRRLTYDISLNLARILFELNHEMTFNYVSGAGTDSSEKGRTMWARVKGKTENDIMKLGFKGSYMFRPGAIIPLRGIKSKTRLYQFFYDYFMWLLKLIKVLSPGSVVDTTQIGLAMIHSALRGYPKPILDPKDIQALAKK